jgi:hypothetical protein
VVDVSEHTKEFHYYSQNDQRGLMGDNSHLPQAGIATVFPIGPKNGQWSATVMRARRRRYCRGRSRRAHAVRRHSPLTAAACRSDRHDNWRHSLFNY